jgi:hypothetical protein
MSALERIATAAGVKLFDWQVAAIHAAVGQRHRERLCLYHRTGAGKTLTSLLAVAQWGWDDAVVIAPPATHAAWEAMGKRVGVDVVCMSHAKFRMKDTKLSRKVPVIADEFHMFGGHGGQGWKKLEGLAGGLEAPLVMASATPNYNDADRVYCIQRILDRHSCKGGFIQFLYNNCELEHDPFSATPKVIGFLNHKDAEAYLASLPGVAYLPDDLVWSITDVPFSTPTPMAYEVFGYNERKHKLVASIMEDRHTRTYMARVDVDGLIQPHVVAEVEKLIDGATLIYCNHATIAAALSRSFVALNTKHLLVTGKTTKIEKEQLISAFRGNGANILIGTATLATGTDGLDKVCDRLIILDDTDDDSLRRQLVGRIMPRGEDSDASKKQVFRLLQQ